MENQKGEEVFTAEEVLKNLNKEIVFFSKFEQNKDLKSCSYSQGYLTQEIYSCETCYKLTNKIAGICSGCAFNCHKDHDLNHLYFKRNFRCDCGNSNFEIPCLLEKEKDYSNDLNKYNHNFQNKYCYCHEEDMGNMIQCVICEDWYHNEHLDVLTICDEEESDLVCKKCLNEKIDFLQFYPEKEYLKLKKNDEIIYDSNNEEKDFNKDKTQENPIILLNKKRKCDEALSDSSFYDNHKKKISNEITEENNERRKEINIKEIILNDIRKDKEEGSSEFCKMKHYLDSKSDNKEEHDIKVLIKKRDIFIDLKNFYHALCRCSKCKIRYSNAGIDFISLPDFIQDWESRTLIEDKLNKEAAEETTQNHNLISNINNFNFLETKNVQNLPVEKQVHLSAVMKTFSDSFKEYILNLNPENKIITEEHVHYFLSKFKNENPFLKDEDDD